MHNNRSKRQELTKHMWAVPIMTLTAVTATVNDYKDDDYSGREGFDRKNCSMKVIQRGARCCCFVAAFQFRFIKRSMLPSPKSTVPYTVEASVLLINSPMLKSLETSLYGKFSCMYAILVGVICEITSNLLQSRIWALTKI